MGLGEDLVAIYGTLEADRSPHEPVLDQIRTLFLPFQGDMTTRGYGGRRIGTVFDSTGAVAADSLVNFMVGNLFPPTGDWVKLRGPEGATVELDTDAATIMLALENTNFYTEVAKCLKDLMILGNSVMYIEEEGRRLQSDGSTFEGVEFEAVNLKDCYWKMGRYNEPLVFCREYYLSNAEIKQYFDYTVSAEDPFEESKVLHFVLPRATSPVNVPGDQPFISVWTTGEGDVLRTGGYSYQPYIVSRLDVVPGEQYGRGRGHLARPDAAGANEIIRQVLLAIGRDINPVLMTENDSLMDSDISASGLLVVKPGTQMSPSYLNSGTNYNAAFEIARQTHQQIKQAFMADILLDPDTQPRSAEESRQRSERLIQRLAGPARSIETNFLTPIMESLISLMVQGGVLPEIERQGVLNVNFVSPFYVAQREMVAQKTYRFVARRLEIFNAVQDPSLLDDIDFDALTKIDAENSDVPPEIFKTREEVEEMREARAQQAMMQQMMQMAEQMPADQGATPAGPEEQIMEANIAE